MSENEILVCVVLPYLWFTIPLAILFQKAGRPWWAAMVPVFNLLVVLDVAQLPLWWFVFYFIPVVGIWFFIRASLGLAQSFGKGKGGAILFVFLYPITSWILALGPSKYTLAQNESKLFS
jgi:hypothetical protein